MLGSRSFRALMRRNLIYRMRNWIGSFFEFFLPVFFVVVLILIKGAVENTDGLEAETIPAYLPNVSDTFTPFSFGDYVTAMRADRKCTTQQVRIPAGVPPQFLQTLNQSASSTTLGITGIFDSGYNWQVPFVKCDSEQCEEDGQDANDFCEYFALGLAPSDIDDTVGQAQVEQFKDYIYATYPALLDPMQVKFDFQFVYIFGSNQEMQDYVTSSDYGKDGRPKLGLGVVLDGTDPSINYNYYLRVNATNFNAPEEAARPAAITTPPTDQLFDRFAKQDDQSCFLEGGTPNLGANQESCTYQYVFNGALVIQRLVGDWIMKQEGAADLGFFVSENGVIFAPFPSFEYEENGFYSAIATFVPLLVTLGLLYPVAAMIRYIALEKELRQKELMKMMSVTESDIGWSWFLTFESFHFLTAIAASGAMVGLYEKSSFGLMFIFWILTMTAVVVFTMFMASFFAKATRGTLVGLLIFFVGYFLTLIVDSETGNQGTIFLISLHPVGAFAYGIQEIGRLEDAGVGLTGTNIDSTDAPSGYTFLNTLQNLFLCCIIWGILTWYVNRVLRTPYGQPLKWYFPFTSSYWCPGSGSAEFTPPGDIEYDEGVPVEQVSDALKEQTNDGESIEIRNLKKVFGEKTAVDGLSLSIYKNQITALLGHNGAGKTTTISMLTGMIAPTEGFATIAGKDIRTDMTGIRQEIGICLQHDCLFPMLTVREHVQFFARVKGMYADYTTEEAEAKVDTSIKDVALFEKRNTLSKNLSGGMKRKLSVAIAFCGDSKTVLLDEPTSGMDPFARRFTWDVIRQYRQDRCIILTTHFMDEADILGDSIAIMAEGRLRCVGSSLFLKKAYGVGYQLTIEKKPEDVVGEHKDKIDEELTHIVKDAVPEASLLSEVGTELSFQLPLGAASNFKPMFDGLDNAVDNGGIITYGVGITTLDEVFLLVARGDSGGQSKAEFASSVIDRAKSIADADSATKSARSQMDLENDGLFSRHVGALFKKRALNFKRDKKAWCCTTILPSLFVLIGLIIFKFAAPNRDLESLTLDLEDYNTGIDTQRNPILYNEPGYTYTCQAQRCIYDPPIVVSPETNEVYYYCGFESFLLSEPSCTVDSSDSVIDEITEAGAFGVPSIAVNVSQASSVIFDSWDEFAASQYSGIYFTHEKASDISGTNTTYEDAVIAECLNTTANYTTPDDCPRFAGIGYTIRYNFTAKHIAPTMQSYADEAIVRDAKNDSSFRIVTSIAPFPLTSVEKSLGEAQDSFTVWFLITLSFPFIMGFYATFVVAERESKAKHLQTVAGVKSTAYWLSTWLWDTANYQFPCWITIMLFFAFSLSALTTTDRGVVGGVIMLIVLFGPAAAAFTYCFSFMFKSPSVCNLIIIISAFIIGLGGTLASFILRIIGESSSPRDDSLILAAQIVEWILRFLPPFCLSHGIYSALNIDSYQIWAGSRITVWDSSVILFDVIFLAWESVVYLYLAIKIDDWSNNPSAVSRWNKFIDIITCRACFCPRRQHGELQVSIPDDDDVVAEQDRVLRGDANDDAIVLSQLTKVYDNGKLAVNNLSLGIPPGQCFGLLGINGAGKTTTMGMLTCEFPPSSGDATLAGYSVSREPEKTRRRIGYCPQFDAHFTNMTGREHVELYASIKGVPAEMVSEAARFKLSEVGLSEEDSDRISMGYSGGMKRRLSLACATIGQPRIVFLDECSTGVDPVARREIWQMVSDMVTGGADGSTSADQRTSVVLTTHSMEEAEALCPRIAIMAGGKIRCLGSAQHLKNKFGQGYQVEMKIRNPDKTDRDYQAYMERIMEGAGIETPKPDEAEVDESGVAGIPGEDEIFLNMEKAKAGLQAATGDSFLVDKVVANDPTGNSIFKDASSAIGVELHELAGFATREIRMRNLYNFINEKYPKNVLRERQYNKVRYEVSSDGIRISDVFVNIEDNKGRFVMDEYSVSQTSLEQVFNMHAAEAERLKQGTNDS